VCEVVERATERVQVVFAAAGFPFGFDALVHCRLHGFGCGGLGGEPLAGDLQERIRAADLVHGGEHGGMFSSGEFSELAAAPADAFAGSR